MDEKKKEVKKSLNRRKTVLWNLKEKARKAKNIIYMK
jgi:hypothetical protein